MRPRQLDDPYFQSRYAYYILVGMDIMAALMNAQIDWKAKNAPTP